MGKPDRSSGTDSRASIAAPATPRFPQRSAVARASPAPAPRSDQLADRGVGHGAVGRQDHRQPATCAACPCPSTAAGAYSAWSSCSVAAFGDGGCPGATARGLATWSLPAPLPRPGTRDLLYPSWFEGDWVATSADLSGIEPEIKYAVRFIQDPSGRIVGDRAFNANSVGRALLGEQLQRVRNDPEPQPTSPISAEIAIWSPPWWGAAANSRPRISSSRMSSACGCCMAPAIRVSQVETLSRYVRIHANRIEAQQWQVSYALPPRASLLKPSGTGAERCCWSSSPRDTPIGDRGDRARAERFEAGIVDQARHATTRQGTTGRAGELIRDNWAITAKSARVS